LKLELLGLNGESKNHRTQKHPLANAEEGKEEVG
jgi:hypothetical protein